MDGPALRLLVRRCLIPRGALRAWRPTTRTDAFELEVLGLSLVEALRFWLERELEPRRRSRRWLAIGSTKPSTRAPSGAPPPRVPSREAPRHRHLRSARDRGRLRRAVRAERAARAHGAADDARRHGRGRPRGFLPTPLARGGGAVESALASTRRRKAIVEEALELCSAGAPATALLLGKVCWAEELDEEAYALLDAGYVGLVRPSLREVLAVHRAHRDPRVRRRARALARGPPLKWAMGPRCGGGK